MRGLVVAGPADAATVAAALAAWIFETAGLEPGFELGRAPIGFGVAARPLPTKRKILGGSAPPPPFVVDGTGRVEPAATAGVLLLAGAPANDRSLAVTLEQLSEEALVVCDADDVDAVARIAKIRARTAFFGLDGDAPSRQVAPTWLGALAPRDQASGALPFDLYGGGSYCGRFALPALANQGAGPDIVRNARNAIGAVAIAAEGFGVDIERARRALASFAGLRAT